jgi:hypothetical protein
MKGPNEGGSGSSGGFGWTGRSGNGRGRLGEGGWRWSVWSGKVEGGGAAERREDQ